MEEEPLPAEAACIWIDELATALDHPRAVRLADDAGDLHPSRRQVDHEQDGETRQPISVQTSTEKKSAARACRDACGGTLARSSAAVAQAPARSRAVSECGRWCLGSHGDRGWRAPRGSGYSPTSGSPSRSGRPTRESPRRPVAAPDHGRRVPEPPAARAEPTSSGNGSGKSECRRHDLVMGHYGTR